MKKTLTLILAIAGGASSVFAQAGSSGSSTSLFTWGTPTNFTSNSFQVTLSITGGVQGSPAVPVDGYDLWLATAAANSGLFNIDTVTYSRFTNFGNLGPGLGDALSNTTDITSGYVRNTNDLGNIDSTSGHTNAIANGAGPFQVATLTIDFGTLAANHTYTFFTTLGANTPLGGTANSNSHYTDVTDSSGKVYTVAQSSFSFMTAAVPEPATWSLLGLGGLGSLGLTLLRVRRQG